MLHFWIIIRAFFPLPGGRGWKRGGPELRGWPQLPLGEGAMVVYRSQQVRGKH